MKQYLLISVLFVILVLATSIKSYSQGVAINNDGSEADGSAMLDITSTNSGLLIPRMTSTQRGAITSPANGLLIFQTDGEAGFYYYTGSTWLRITNANDASDFVSGTGTLNYVPKWTPDGVTIGNSQIFDDGTNVGIGTTSPTAKLHVSAPASGSTIKVGRLSGKPSIEGTDSWMMIEQSGTNPLALNYYGSNHVVMVNGGGNVGIGTISPATKLHVNGTVRFQGLETGTQTTGLMIDASGNLSSRTLNITNWDNAYSWGDHAAEGYLTSFSEVDPTWSGTANQTGTIGRSGNVGIGTINPAFKLDVRNGAHIATNTDTEPFIVSRNYKTTNHEEVRIGLDDSNLNFHYVNDESASRLNFRLQNTDTEAGGGVNASDYTIMTLSANSSEGRVGIGTTSPSAQFHTTGTVRFANYPSGANGAIVRSDASGNLAITNFSGSSSDILLGNNTFGTIEDAGGVVSNCGTSNYVPKMASSTELSCSQIYDNGTNVGIGTTAPSEKLHVQGNAKATGYIVAGNATTTSTTRHEMKEFYWTGHKSVDHGSVSWSLGSIPLPDGASYIRIRNINCDFDGYHEDGNEGYAAMIYVNNTSCYVEMSESNTNGFISVDWNFNAEETGLSSYFYSTPTVYALIRDNGGSWGDKMHALNIKVEVYYEYDVGLQDGDIAASGRIYANNTQAVGDLAEHFEYDGPTAPGFVVSYVPGSDNEYELCNEPYSNHITGVISENPSVVLNSPEQGPPLALAGRVTVKLVDSDELIKGGDFITSSSIGGYGMKAKRPGPVIGYATKNQIPGENFVEVLLQPGKYYIPTKYIDDDFDEMEEKENQRTGKW